MKVCASYHLQHHVAQSIAAIVLFFDDEDIAIAGAGERVRGRYDAHGKTVRLLLCPVLS